MKSFQLLRTNPALTTNIYIIVNDKLYLESINSSDELNDLKLKRKTINQDSLYEYKLAEFWSGWSNDLIYLVRNNEDPQYVYDDYSVQYDDIYRSGGDYVQDQWYDEEFEYFAPLYVNKSSLPDWFFIFRVDGHSYDEINPSNLKEKILNKLKFIHNWDLKDSSTISEFIKTNINRTQFPEASLYLSYKENDFSKIKGFNLNSGFVEQYKMYDSLWIKTQPFFQLEKIITEEYKNNSVVYPLIWNFKFLFNDSPADKDKYKKYSINRYYGFYLDKLEEISTYTPYVIGYIFNENQLYNDKYYKYIIKNNIFYTIILENNQPIIINLEAQYTTKNADPFLGGWNDSKDTNYWYWYNNNFYKITRTFIDNEWVYSLVSDMYITNNISDIFDLTDYNNHLITFKNSNNENNIYLNNNVVAQQFTADVYLCYMNNKWATIQKGNNNAINLYTDYTINSDVKSITYTLAGNNEVFSLTLGSLDSPPILRIYRAKLLDIKDFDFDRVDTNFARYEYEDNNKNSDSTEPKLFFKEWLDQNTSTNYLEDINKVKLISDIFDNLEQQSIPLSTEYNINSELFTNLDIWNKNQSVCKWGVKDSINTMDYPYRMYNGENGSWFNFSPNLLSESSDWKERNFDYCYFNWPVSNISTQIPFNTNHIWNSSNYNVSSSYSSYSINNNNIINNLNLEYFNLFFDADYIEYNPIITDKKSKLQKIKQKKYAVFNHGDKDNPSYCVFKGIKYIAKKVVNIIPNDEQSTIEEITLANTDQYNNYKFSHIMHFSTNAKIPTTRLKDDDIITSTGNIYYAKPIINITINNSDKLIVIDIEIPCGSNPDLSEIFNYTIKDNQKGRIDRFLYRDNPLFNDWTANPNWTNSSNNTIYLNNEILLDNVELLNAFNIINFINNFSSIEEQQRQLIDINYIIDNNIYNIDNQWREFTLPVMIQIEFPENYTAYQGYSVAPGNILNIELQIDNKIQPTEEFPIIKNINYLKQNESIAYSGIEIISTDVFTMSSINHPDAISMFRYNGWYDVIYKDLNIHNGYNFSTDLFNYGQVEEIISKINPQGSILKTKNTSPQVSPRIDEWGISWRNNFIFMSPWDKNFFLKFYNDIRDSKQKTILPDKINKFTAL